METYAIVFKGDVVEGFEKAAVQAQLARLLKLDPKKAAALFSGKQIVLKKTADKAAAAKYGKALKKVGADVKVRIIKGNAAAKPKPPAPKKPAAPVFQAADDAPAFQAADDAPAFQAADPEPAADTAMPAFAAADPEPGAVDTSHLSVAPNEGDLFEPQPEADAPELDLSGMELAENDGSLLVEPPEEIIVEIDLSEFSVKDNDGTPLIEASNEAAPEVDVPDFGLDEPGAILDTIQEEKELLNPNTMGMSLAQAGAELLEDEPPPPPPPPAPDTSKINLVPNFDT